MKYGIRILASLKQHASNILWFLLFLSYHGNPLPEQDVFRLVDYSFTCVHLFFLILFCNYVQISFNLFMQNYMSSPCGYFKIPPGWHRTWVESSDELFLLSMNVGAFFWTSVVKLNCILLHSKKLSFLFELQKFAFDFFVVHTSGVDYLFTV